MGSGFKPPRWSPTSNSAGPADSAAADSASAGTGVSAPRWNLAAIYPSFDAPEYARDKERLQTATKALLDLLQAPLPTGAAASSASAASGAKAAAAGAAGATGAAAGTVAGDQDRLAESTLRLLKAYEEAGDLAENLEAYAAAVYTTDTRNARALGEINSIETLSLPLGRAAVLFRSRLAEAESCLLPLARQDERLKPYAFFIGESFERARRQMPADLEDLANDLSRSGGDAWSRLQEAVSSTATALWDPSTGERKTVIALRALAHDPDRKIRERAYRAEMEAWKSMEIPLATSLNGVKGTALTLDTRRGWASPLDKAAFQSRISRKALDSLISVMEESLPLFRRYLKAKARLMGVDACAFFDLFAPLGSAGKKWTWEEGRDFIVDRFTAFDPGMGNFALHAYAFSWMDGESRDGKIGGAYCTDFPLIGESRILCNYEGSFDSVTTVAHELGHAWHHEVLKDLPRTQSGYPMTLAETASIFAETVVLEGALAQASPQERLGLIEGNLKDSCQVVVDILSRFYFERNLFERRSAAELSSEELCTLMTEAQKATYGDGLDEQALHPYMWAVKSHYYSTGLGFYNYPYAFGLLFSLSLYARSEAEGPQFARTYRELLRRTGSASAADVGRSAGFDIEGTDFWRKGIGLIAERVEDFEALIKDMK